MVELADLRRDAGMTEFSWNSFLRLFSAALRGQDGCKARVSLMPDKSVRLALSYKLQAATIASNLTVMSSSTPPSAAGVEDYLRDLRGFMVAAVAASRRTDGPRDTVPSVVRAAEPVLSQLGDITSSQTVSVSQSARTAKKRVGSLVDPNARKRGGRSNPFQLR